MKSRTGMCAWLAAFLLLEAATSALPAAHSATPEEVLAIQKAANARSVNMATAAEVARVRARGAASLGDLDEWRPLHREYEEALAAARADAEESALAIGSIKDVPDTVREAVHSDLHRYAKSAGDYEELRVLARLYAAFVDKRSGTQQIAVLQGLTYEVCAGCESRLGGPQPSREATSPRPSLTSAHRASLIAAKRSLDDAASGPPASTTRGRPIDPLERLTPEQRAAFAEVGEMLDAGHGGFVWPGRAQTLAGIVTGLERSFAKISIELELVLMRSQLGRKVDRLAIVAATAAFTQALESADFRTAYDRSEHLLRLLQAQPK